MMYKYLPYISSVLTAPLPGGNLTMFVIEAIADYFLDTLDFGSDVYTYLTIFEGINIEQVKVTGAVSAGASSYLVIERAQGPDEVAIAFTAAAVFHTGLNSAAIIDLAATLPYVPNITGSGLVEVTGTDPININVDELELEGTQGVEVIGSWPSFIIGLTTAASCCGTEENGDNPAEIFFDPSGILEGFVSGTTISAYVDPPNFTGIGVNITGMWPNLNFNVTSTGGATVTAGDGLGQTGAPSGATTLFISPTGVTAGTYGDIVVNARGQFTYIEPGFNPISDIIAGDGMDVSRTGGAVTIAALPAAVGTAGIVALADADDPLDPLDETTAVTPKLLATVLADLESGDIVGDESYSGEADAAYNNLVSMSPVAIVLDTGESAIVNVAITVRANAAPTTAQDYALAVFSSVGAAKLHGNVLLTQNNQFMTFILEGPFNDGLAIKTTTLPGSSAVISYALNAIKV